MTHGPSLNILVTLIFAFVLGWFSSGVFGPISETPNQTRYDYPDGEPTPYGILVKSFLATIIMLLLSLFTKNIEHEVATIRHDNRFGAFTEVRPRIPPPSTQECDTKSE